jgi:hypothetical protein
MAKKSLNLSGQNGKTYDLEQISTQNTRLDSGMKLIVEVWYWNPDSDIEERRSPNPPSPEIGRIWLSKLVPLEELNAKVGG